MTIEITENLVGMWQFAFDGGDFMGGVTEQDDGSFFLQYRFRYYKDDKIGLESEDDKHWYEGTLHAATREHAVNEVRSVMEKLKKAGMLLAGEEIEVIEILMRGGDVEAFVQELTDQPWAHAQEVPPKAEMN